MTPEPGGLDYVLANSSARVLRGNVEITRAVIDSCPAHVAHRFTSGVLNDISKLKMSLQERLLNELEVQLLGGRPQESMSWCAVSHSDKGKSEIHIIVALMDLVFGKLVNPYVDRIDRMRYSAWMDQFNFLNGLQSPSQCLRIEPPFNHLRIPKEDVDFLRSVWLQVQKWVKEGNVRNRVELGVFLAASGYKVRLDKFSGGPLEQPEIIGPSGRKLRLTGSVYYHIDFGTSAAIPLDLKDKKAVSQHVANLAGIISERMDYRAYWTIGRLYGSHAQKALGKGKARERLEELNAGKLRSIRLAKARETFDYEHLLKVAKLLESGHEPRILSLDRGQKTSSINAQTAITPDAAGLKDSADEPKQAAFVRLESPEPAPAEADTPAPVGRAPEADPAQRERGISPANDGRKKSAKASRTANRDDLPQEI